MAAAGGPSFLEALHGRVEASIDACTRCGKCVTACPMITPAGIDTGRDGANAPAIADGLLDLVSGGPARIWAAATGTKVPIRKGLSPVSGGLRPICRLLAAP